MPGSANLPKELVTPRRRGSRPQLRITSSHRRSRSILRVRVAAPHLLVALGALVVAERHWPRSSSAGSAVPPSPSGSRANTRAHPRRACPRQRLPLISRLPCRVRVSGITPRPGGPHIRPVAKPHRRRTSRLRRSANRRTHRRRVRRQLSRLPLRPRPRPSSPAPSSSSPQRRRPRTRRLAQDQARAPVRAAAPRLGPTEHLDRREYLVSQVLGVSRRGFRRSD